MATAEQAGTWTKLHTQALSVAEKYDKHEVTVWPVKNNR